MTSLERRYIEAGRGRISYLASDVAGGEAPLLHLAHATGLNSATYAPLLEALATRFRVRAWDARGHGLTTLPADPARLRTWETYVRDLGRFLEALRRDDAGEGQRFLLVGHSMGATASLELAATRPDLASGLVAVDPPLLGPVRAPVLAAMRRAGRMKDPEIASRARRRRAEWSDRETVRAAYRGRGAFQTWPDSWLDGYLDGGLVPGADGGVRLACTPEWEAATFRAVSTTVWLRVPRLSVPAILIKATHGSTVAPSAPAVLRRLAPAMRQRVVEGASHFLPMERPELLVEEIHAVARAAGLRV